MLNFEILPFAPQYADGVAQIEALCFSEPWSAQAILDSFAADTHFLVAVAEGKVIGYGGVQTVADEGYVTNIATHPQCRRQGVGNALTAGLLQIAKGKGLAFISLEVRQSNLAAQNLYQAHGFTLQGRRKNFYRQPTEDALILTHFLKD